jgi:broad specificity phosphatase PhoE
MGSTLPVIEHPGWNEYSGDALYKAYHGEGWAKARAKGDVREFYRTIKLALLDWSEEKLAGDLPETWRAFGERAAAAMHAACDGLPPEASVLAASSGGAISRAVSTILEAPARTAIELNLQYRNSAFCEIFVSPRSMRLVSFNCIPHLDRPDRVDAITYS